MARPRASPNRTQSPLAPRDAQRRHAALPSRCHCSLHQQPSRTRRAHDEAPSKNLRRLSLVGRCNGLRPHPLLLLDRKEAGLEHHRRSHPPPIELGQIPTSCLSHPANLGSNKLCSLSGLIELANGILRRRSTSNVTADNPLNTILIPCNDFSDHADR